MLYTKEFIAGIKSQPASGLVKACAMATEKLGNKSTWDEEAYGVLGEAYALVSSVVEAGLVSIRDVASPTLRGRVNEDCTVINQYLMAVRKECVMLVQLERIELLKIRSRQSLGVDTLTAETPDTSYRFEPHELTRLRDLVAEIKQLLARCKPLDPRIHARMVRRVADLESDLSDTMTEWDRFWGLMGEARLFINQCGDTARQFVRGFSEMSQIVGSAQVRAAGLPDGHRFPPLTLDGHSTLDQ